MNRGRRALLAGLGLVLVAVLLAGCGNSQASNGSKNSTSANSQNKEPVVAYSDAGLVNVWRVLCMHDMERAAKEQGVKLLTADGHMDPAKQLSDVQNLLAQKPDVIIVAPVESKAMTPIVGMCDKAKIPLIVIDRTIDAEPGKGMFKSEIVQSHELSGILLANKAVEMLTKKYGEPRGNIVKLQGAAGASPVIDAQKGWDEVMASFPNIKVVGVQDTGFTKEGGMKVMEDFLQTFPKGKIDGVWSDYSDMTIGGIEAIKAAKRNELFIVGEGGSIQAIEQVLNGSIARETQTPPYFGDIGIKTALDIRAGKDIPKVVPVAIKMFDFDNKAFVQNYYNKIKAAGLAF
jgi:ribose transport system substrate-binding protein